MSQDKPSPDPRGYETMYLRFLTMKRAFPHLNHRDHEPKPRRFGLEEREAAFIRARIDREHERKM